MRPSASTLSGWQELPLGDHILAECPRWDATRARLSWVDIMAGTVAWASWDGSWVGLQRRAVGKMPTAAEPLGDNRDGWAVAVDGAVRLLGAQSGAGPGTPVCRSFPAVRTNDMTRDPSGRLLVGLFTEDRVSPHGGVVALDLTQGRTQLVAKGFVTSNGLAVTPDGSTLYAVDTARGRISRYRLDVEYPDPGTVIVHHEGSGVLDGMALGPDGDLWVAVWGAGAIHRYSLDGGLRAILPVPVTRPSALTVAYLDVPYLIITTARSDTTQRPPLDPSPEGRLYALPVPG